MRLVAVVGILGLSSTFGVRAAPAQQPMTVESVEGCYVLEWYGDGGHAAVFPDTIALTQFIMNPELVRGRTWTHAVRADSGWAAHHVMVFTFWEMRGGDTLYVSMTDTHGGAGFLAVRTGAGLKGVVRTVPATDSAPGPSWIAVARRRACLGYHE